MFLHISRIKSPITLIRESLPEQHILSLPVDSSAASHRHTAPGWFMGKLSFVNRVELSEVVYII